MESILPKFITYENNPIMPAFKLAGDGFSPI